MALIRPNSNQVYGIPAAVISAPAHAPGGGGIPANALTLNGQPLTLNGQVLTLGA